MPTFTYKARDAVGHPVTDRIDAPSAGDAATILRERGLFPITISAGPGGGFFNADLAFLERIPPAELIMFTRQLVTLYRAGIPLVSGLDALEKQSTNPVLRKVVARILVDVKGGDTLSQAFAKQPKFFDPLYVNTVRAGEVGGVLDQVLSRLADLLEHETETRQNVKAAVRYPVMVIIALLSAMLMLVTFVVPKFAALFQQFGQELPLPTRILIGVHHVLTAYTIPLAAAVVGLVLLFRWYARSPEGSVVVDGAKLRVPIFGPLVLRISMSRFAHMFGTLTKSGVPVLDNLDICARTLGNAAIASDLQRARIAVEKGEPLSAPLSTSRYFLPMVVHMVAVGEKTGDMEGMMEAVAHHYDMETRYAIKNLTTLIEPILTLAMGVMVLFVALAIFLPLWNVTKLFQQPH